MWFLTKISVLILGLSSLTIAVAGKKLFEPKIIGGRDTNITEVPWQLLQYKDGSQNCGAVIIGPREVLSAGHCFARGDGFYQVRAGSDQLNSGGKNYTVEAYIVHPNYNISKPIVTHDIAFARVKEPFEFSETSQPIVLAEDEPEGGEEVLISGFGLIKINVSDPDHITGELPEVLQSVVLSVIDKETCREWYSDYEWDVVDDDQICVGVPEGGKAASFGDSGGPLVFNNQLVGITSWGDPTASPHHPSIYTSVPYYKEWIEEQIKAFE